MFFRIAMSFVGGMGLGAVEVGRYVQKGARSVLVEVAMGAFVVAASLSEGAVEVFTFVKGRRS